MMKVEDEELVIVRGINAEWREVNFSELWIGFGSPPPKKDAYYVGLYLAAPKSAITHVGIVDNIKRRSDYADFYLKSMIKLKEPVLSSHPVRKHEYRKLSDLGLIASKMKAIRKDLNLL